MKRHTLLFALAAVFPASAASAWLAGAAIAVTVVVGAVEAGIVLPNAERTIFLERGPGDGSAIPLRIENPRTCRSGCGEFHRGN